MARQILLLLLKFLSFPLIFSKKCDYNHATKDFSISFKKKTYVVSLDKINLNQPSFTTKPSTPMTTTEPLVTVNHNQSVSSKLINEVRAAIEAKMKTWRKKKKHPCKQFLEDTSNFPEDPFDYFKWSDNIGQPLKWEICPFKEIGVHFFKTSRAFRGYNKYPNVRYYKSNWKESSLSYLMTSTYQYQCDDEQKRQSEILTT